VGGAVCAALLGEIANMQASDIAMTATRATPQNWNMLTSPPGRFE
jgi:hypothetical protein